MVDLKPYFLQYAHTKHHKEPFRVNKLKLYEQFSKPLLLWFALHGRKNLPWQHPRTPYRVWISEIMLQQTQVQTVIPYFERFMQRFPDISDLAHAHEDDVLSLWSGLGYYSRARNLHHTAKLILQHHQGVFPNDRKLLNELPGIGPPHRQLSYRKHLTSQQRFWMAM